MEQLARGAFLKAPTGLNECELKGEDDDKGKSIYPATLAAHLNGRFWAALCS